MQTRIAFETVGRGHPLVLSHGFFGDRTTWRSAGHVAALADRFRLVLVDARGHGESDAPHDADSYRIDRQADDVVAVLDALGIRRTAFWGASMGGTIGLHLLARHPERLTALIAGGAHADRVAVDPADVEQEAELFRTQGVAPFIDWLERRGPLPPWMRDAMRAADPHALAALTTALAERGSVLDSLAHTTVPVLLLAGDRDPHLPAIRHTAARIPSATLVELPDCGHLDAFLRTAPPARLGRGALPGGVASRGLPHPSGAGYGGSCFRCHHVDIASSASSRGVGRSPCSPQPPWRRRRWVPPRRRVKRARWRSCRVT